jgi:hypothetical protein
MLGAGVERQTDGVYQRDLTERDRDFNYGYRMRCDACGGVTDIDAATYFREGRIRAHVQCSHCPEEIHFGPAVAALRNSADPTLSDAVLTTLAWYHTSTAPDWPSPGHRSLVEARLRPMAGRFRHLGGVEAVIERHSNLALHLGTYEAAIENMFRRMSDQADGDSQFYLYRVALRSDRLRVEPGYHDENEDEVSNLSIDELDVRGVDVVRYLNVHEALGSMSIAVRPGAIEAVQRLPIPAPDFAGSLSLPLAAKLTAWAAEGAAIEQAAIPLRAIPSHELRMLKFKRSAAPHGLVTLADQLDQRRWRMWEAVDDALMAGYLSDVSPVVAEALLGATRRSRPAAPDAVNTQASRVGSLAALLTCSAQVVARLQGLPWQVLPSR